MLAADILNDIFLERFQNTERKVVLLPTCMRKLGPKECKSLKSGNHLKCQICNLQCNVGKITKLGNEVGFDTFMVLHSSNFFELIKKWRDQDEVGVVGVACVLNLLKGGYEMEALNIPSQCVFLNYPGCKKHWEKYERPTELDCVILEERLEIKKSE
ncbi:MAG: DUF116 domain-containing protein [Fusobacteriota bacterium]